MNVLFERLEGQQDGVLVKLGESQEVLAPPVFAVRGAPQNTGLELALYPLSDGDLGLSDRILRVAEVLKGVVVVS